jgi:hypothetical protein
MFARETSIEPTSAAWRARNLFFGDCAIMNRPERSEAKGYAHLSRTLPLRARMRPALHRKARSLVRRGDLSPDCLVISFFELNESGPMCWVQFTGDHDVRQTLAVPLTEVMLDRRPRTAPRAERSGRTRS